MAQYTPEDLRLQAEVTANGATAAVASARETTRLVTVKTHLIAAVAAAKAAPAQVRIH